MVSTETDPIVLTAADLAFNQLFELSVAEDASTENKGLELAHYNAAANAADAAHKLGTGYLDGQNTFHESATLADATHNVLAKKFNVTITMKTVTTVTDSQSNVWTLNDALKAIYDQDFKIYVVGDSKSGADRVRVFNQDASETTDGEESPTFDNNNQINSGAKDINTLIERSGTDPNYSYGKKANASITYSFYAYVYGNGSGTSTPDTSSVSGKVRVVVANAADTAPATPWDSSAA